MMKYFQRYCNMMLHRPNDNRIKKFSVAAVAVVVAVVAAVVVVIVAVVIVVVIIVIVISVVVVVEVSEKEENRFGNVRHLCAFGVQQIGCTWATDIYFVITIVDTMRQRKRMPLCSTLSEQKILTYSVRGSITVR